VEVVHGARGLKSRQRARSCEFPLEKTTLILSPSLVLRALLRFFRRPPVRMGRVDNRAIRTTVVRNAQFVSFISASGAAARHHPDRHDRRLRRQKLVRMAVGVSLAAAGSWIAIESARALSIF